MGTEPLLPLPLEALYSRPSTRPKIVVCFVGGGTDPSESRFPLEAAQALQEAFGSVDEWIGLAELLGDASMKDTLIIEWNDHELCAGSFISHHLASRGAEIFHPTHISSSEEFAPTSASYGFHLSSSWPKETGQGHTTAPTLSDSLPWRRWYRSDSVPHLNFSEWSGEATEVSTGEKRYLLRGRASDGYVDNARIDQQGRLFVDGWALDTLAGDYVEELALFVDGAYFKAELSFRDRQHALDELSNSGIALKNCGFTFRSKNPFNAGKRLQVIALMKRGIAAELGRFKTQGKNWVREDGLPLMLHPGDLRYDGSSVHCASKGLTAKSFAISEDSRYSVRIDEFSRSGDELRISGTAIDELESQPASWLAVFLEQECVAIFQVNVGRPGQLRQHPAAAAEVSGFYGKRRLSQAAQSEPLEVIALWNSGVAARAVSTR
jgi:hypothetical protein